jgi:hypothetical protein
MVIDGIFGIYLENNSTDTDFIEVCTQSILCIFEF